MIRGYADGEPVYLVPRADGEVVVGATVEERADTTVTAGAVLRLLRAAVDLVPELAEYDLVEAVAGLRPGTPDNAPILGPLPGRPGVLAATGHHRHGIVLTPVTADLIADLVDHRPAGPAARPLPERFRRPAVTGPSDRRDATSGWRRDVTVNGAGRTLPGGATVADLVRAGHRRSSAGSRSRSTARWCPAAGWPATAAARRRPGRGAQRGAGRVSGVPFELGGVSFASRLILGTGGAANLHVLEQAIRASGTELVTLALRRVDTAPGTGRAAGRCWTGAGYGCCRTPPAATPPTEAVKVAHLAREAFDTDWVKLEVIGDERTPAARRGGAAARRRGAGRGRVHRAAVHQRRPGAGPPAGRRGLRRGDAGRRADRLRAGHRQPAPHPADPAGRGRAGDPGRRHRHRLRRGAGDGAGLRRGAAGQRGHPGRRPGGDGHRHAARGRGGPAGVRRRPDPPPLPRPRRPPRTREGPTCDGTVARSPPA